MNGSTRPKTRRDAGEGGLGMLCRTHHIYVMPSLECRLSPAISHKIEPARQRKIEQTSDIYIIGQAAKSFPVFTTQTADQPTCLVHTLLLHSQLSKWYLLKQLANFSSTCFSTI